MTFEELASRAAARGVTSHMISWELGQLRLVTFDPDGLMITFGVVGNQLIPIEAPIPVDYERSVRRG